MIMLQHATTFAWNIEPPQAQLRTWKAPQLGARMTWSSVPRRTPCASV